MIFILSLRLHSWHKFHLVVRCMRVLSCVGLCDHMDCSLPGSSVFGMHQARILEQVAIPFARASSQLRLNLYLLYLLHRQVNSFLLSHLGRLFVIIYYHFYIKEKTPYNHLNRGRKNLYKI